MTVPTPTYRSLESLSGFNVETNYKKRPIEVYVCF